MIYDRDELVVLSRLYMDAKKISGTKLGMIAAGNNRFVGRLLRGDDCRTTAAEQLSDWLDQNWPKGLPWPRHIRRRETMEVW